MLPLPSTANCRRFRRGRQSGRCAAESSAYRRSSKPDPGSAAGGKTPAPPRPHHHPQSVTTPGRTSARYASHLNHAGATMTVDCRNFRRFFARRERSPRVWEDIPRGPSRNPSGYRLWPRRAPIRRRLEGRRQAFWGVEMTRATNASNTGGTTRATVSETRMTSATNMMVSTIIDTCPLSSQFSCVRDRPS